MALEGVYLSASIGGNGDGSSIVGYERATNTKDGTEIEREKGDGGSGMTGRWWEKVPEGAPRAHIQMELTRNKCVVFQGWVGPPDGDPTPIHVPLPIDSLKVWS